MPDTMTHWTKNRIQNHQNKKYMPEGKDFIDEARIQKALSETSEPDPIQVRELLKKSLEIQTLTLEEAALLIRVKDPALLAEMEACALKVKKKVYDNRIVTFAPLYMSSQCVNNCLYCGFKSSNSGMERAVTSLDTVKEECETLAGEIGHKRVIAVYGEHPASDTDFIAETIRTIYSVRVKTKKGFGQIRRVNINAAPLSVEDFKLLHEVGIGTFQIFQETYHHETYAKMHPKGTLKGDYEWRLYAMHRAMESGIDDVGIGTLFGLYDWRFEVLGLLSHAIELEDKIGIGPHTISFPRLEPAMNNPFMKDNPWLVNDEALLKAITVLRLAVPYTGMIITCRETPAFKNKSIGLGITQTDASTKLGLGAYSKGLNLQKEDRQQFILGDTRSLDELVRDLAGMGYITSFCTAGYRCGRTGKCIMDLLRSGTEGKFCKLNAVLTFREWIDDFASEGTKTLGETILKKEIEEIRLKSPQAFEAFMKSYERICQGERDLYF